MPSALAAATSSSVSMPPPSKSNQDMSTLAPANTTIASFPGDSPNPNSITCTFAGPTTSTDEYDIQLQHNQHHHNHNQQEQQTRQFYQHSHLNITQQQQQQQHLQHYDVLATTTTVTSSVANNSTTTNTAITETSLTSFNGNSNLNSVKGNNNNNNSNSVSGNNGNTMSTASNHSHSNSNSSSSNNKVTSDGGGTSLAAASIVSALKKSTAMPSNALQMHATSREDVASLGGNSPLYSQLSATNNTTTTTTNNNNNENNCAPQYNHTNYGNGIIGAGPTLSKENLENVFPPNNNNAGLPFTHAPPGPDSSYCQRDNDDPGDGLGPLPPKWETAYTERGELYFIDHNTGTSHWLDPRLSKFQKKSLEDCGDDELPYGWEKIEDSLYGTYYIDHVNRRTQYENPVLEAKRRAAEQKQELHHHLHHQDHQLARSQTTLTAGHINDDANDDGNGHDDDSSLPGMQQHALNSSTNPLPPPPALPYGPPIERNHLLPYKFTRNPSEMQGERITTTLIKSTRGLGITIVGGDDNADEFLQIKSIVPNGPAWIDGQLRTGDILVYINDTCVLGFTHHEMVNIFQSLLPGDSVTLEVCRGYPLPFDPNDPNNEVVTTIAVERINVNLESDKPRRYDMCANVDGNYNFLDVSGGSNGGLIKGGNLSGDITNSEFILMKKMDVMHTIAISKGTMGFGFTISDSSDGQTVKKILDRNCCPQLQEGDVLLEINDIVVKNKSHLEVVQLLKDCSKTEPTVLKIHRGTTTTAPAPSSILPTGGNVAKLRKNFISTKGLFRSKTPTADLYSTQQKEILPIRPKTPLVDTRRARVKTPNNELNSDCDLAQANSNGCDDLDVGLSLAESKVQANNKSTNSLLEIEAINKEIPFMDPYPKLVTSLSERLAGATLLSDAITGAARGPNKYESLLQPEYATATGHNNYMSGDCNPIYGLSHNPDHAGNPSARSFSGGTSLGLMAPAMQHHENCHCYECQEFQAHKFRQQQQSMFYGMGHGNQLYLTPQQGPSPSPLAPLSGGGQYSPAATSTMPLHTDNERAQKRVNELLSDRRRVGFTPLEHTQYNLNSGAGNVGAYKSPTMAQLGQHQGQHQQQLAFQPAHSHINWAGVPNQNGGISPMLRNGHLDLMAADDATDQYELTEVTLERQALGFGFRIVGGTEEGSQVTVGHIVPGGAADNDHRINTGDEILSIDGINVVHASHHKVVSLMGEAALRGHVTMILRRRVNATTGGNQMQQQVPASILRSPGIRYPYDVIVSRHENEGFGFVIISSSNQYYGSTIGKLISGSPADRCNELKVGDRITAVNRIDIAGMSHGDVVNLIKDSGLHVRLTIGCPKEGAAMGGPHPNNPKQVSPGQISQIPMGYHTPLLLQQQQQQQQSPMLNGNAQRVFELPRTGMDLAGGTPTTLQQPHQL